MLYLLCFIIRIVLYYAFTSSIVGQQDNHRHIQFFEILFMIYAISIKYNVDSSRDQKFQKRKTVRLRRNISAILKVSKNYTINLRRAILEGILGK